MASAEALFERALYAQSVFFCEQAIETLVKAVWVEQAAEGIPPHTHDLVLLTKQTSLSLSYEQLDLLRDLEEQYTSTRYPDAAFEYSQEIAQDYYDKTKELFSWLLRLLN